MLVDQDFCLKRYSRSVSWAVRNLAQFLLVLPATLGSDSPHPPPKKKASSEGVVLALVNEWGSPMAGQSSWTQ